MGEIALKSCPSRTTAGQKSPRQRDNGCIMIHWNVVALTLSMRWRETWLSFTVTVWNQKTRKGNPSHPLPSAWFYMQNPCSFIPWNIGKLSKTSNLSTFCVFWELWMKGTYKFWLWLLMCSNFSWISLTHLLLCNIFLGLCLCVRVCVCLSGFDPRALVDL